MAYEYVKVLAQQTGTDISSWHLKTLFGNATDKNAVNKIFFNMVARTKKNNKEAPKVSKEILDAAKSIGKKESDFIKKAKLAVKEADKEIASLAKKLSKTMGQATKCRLDIQRLSNKVKVDFSKEIEKVLAAGWWTNPIKHDNYIFLETKNPIVLAFKDNSGVSFKKNLGKYSVAINCDDLSLRVLPFENNLSNEALYHMFIDELGYICWGSALGTYNKLNNNFEIEKILNLLASLLSSPSDGSGGYCALYNLTEEYGMPTMPHDCYDCGYSQNTESAKACENCGAIDMLLVHPKFLKKPSTKKAAKK